MTEAPRIVIARYPRKNLQEGTIWMSTAMLTIQFGATRKKFSRVQWLMASGLIAARGLIVSKPELFDHMWGEREDGGPLGKALDVYLMHVRRKLAGMGLLIATEHGIGLSIVFPPVLNLAVAA